jgi:uncharacterized membrane protein
MESWLNSLVVATRRAKKETLDETQEQRALSRIPENTIEKLNSTPSSHSSVENISHLSGLSGAGGVGGAGGALGGDGSSIPMHYQKVSERLSKKIN